MKQLIKKIKYLFKAGDELNLLIKQQEKEIIELERKNNEHRLNLCFDHRQEENHSHFSEQNCDYCKLQDTIIKLKAQISLTQELK